MKEVRQDKWTQAKWEWSQVNSEPTSKIGSEMIRFDNGAEEKSCHLLYHKD